MPKQGKNRLLLSVLLVLFWGVFPAMEVLAGSDSCAECHSQITAEYENSYHGRAWNDKDYSCRPCHNNAGSHLDEPSLKNIVSFGKKSLQTTAEQNRQCLECHETTPHISLWDMSSHSRNDVACVDCHIIHSRSPQVNQLVVCYACHRSLRLAANKISHHPIGEGKIKCSDCHNSHGTLLPKMLVEDNINQLCYRCHAEKRGPFVWEHPPVEENCITCHDAHGSRHENLLQEKVSNLCQDCHNADLHSSRAYDARAGSSSAGRARSIGFAGRSCLNCHGNIHGSTHFEKRGFTR